MKKLMLLGFFSVILLSTLVLAQTSPQQSLQNALEQIAKYFPNDVIHVQISMNDGSQKNYAVTTTNGQVTGFKDGAPDNPTLVITSSQSVLESIYNSADQSAATIHALNNGGISITGVGFINQLKLVFFKIYIIFSGLFSK